jgi:hypothetical protein
MSPPPGPAAPPSPTAGGAPEVELTAPLKCFGGKPMKAEVIGDLKRLGLLPEEALGHVWEALGPLLNGELTKERFDRIMGPFCAKYRADKDDLLRGLAALRSLLRGAAEQDLEAEKFVEDLELLQVDVFTARTIMSGYEQGMILLRGELMMVSLLDHGRALKKVDWRIDQMRGSNRGKNLNAPVAMLTFNYQDGEKADRMTLQVLPPVLRQLREILDEILDEGQVGEATGAKEDGNDEPASP